MEFASSCKQEYFQFPLLQSYTKESPTPWWSYFDKTTWLKTCWLRITQGILLIYSFGTRSTAFSAYKVSQHAIKNSSSAPVPVSDQWTQPVDAGGHSPRDHFSHTRLKPLVLLRSCSQAAISLNKSVKRKQLECQWTFLLLQFSCMENIQPSPCLHVSVTKHRVLKELGNALLAFS